jgi:hypothetical protein
MRSPASNPGYVQRHAWKPDIDKLLRSTLDALTLAMVWGDDKQAAELQVAKLYCAHDRSPGARHHHHRPRQHTGQPAGRPGPAPPGGTAPMMTVKEAHAVLHLLHVLAGDPRHDDLDAVLSDATWLLARAAKTLQVTATTGLDLDQLTDTLRAQIDASLFGTDRCDQCGGLVVDDIVCSCRFCDICGTPLDPHEQDVHPDCVDTLTAPGRRVETVPGTEHAGL